MTLALCVEGVLLGLLTASAWPARRAGLIGQQPRLLSDVTEAEFDQHTRMYVLTSVRAGRSTTKPVIATWDQITAYAAKCSTDIDTLYVCVAQGLQKWYWQYGLITDALVGTFKADGQSARRTPDRTPYGREHGLPDALHALMGRRRAPLCRFRRRPGASA